MKLPTEHDENCAVYIYGPSNGYGLGDCNCPLSEIVPSPKSERVSKMTVFEAPERGCTVSIPLECWDHPSEIPHHPENKSFHSQVESLQAENMPLPENQGAFFFGVGIP